MLRATVLLLIWIACGLARAGDIRLEAWPARVPTPSLRLTATDGKPLDLAALRGKVVLLNYWASWCEPCVNEFPLLSELARGTASSQGLVVIGVNFKESLTTIREFQSRYGSDFPIVQDKTGEHFKQWTKGVLPTTVLIGRDGRARWRITGELDPKDASFTKALDQLLREGAAGHASGKIVVK